VAAAHQGRSEETGTATAMMRDRNVWHRVFLGGLVGGAVYVKNKADADELVQRAKMIADKAATVAAREHFDAELAQDEEPFPLVRASPPTPAMPSSWLFDGPGIPEAQQ
jgi:hypothetical protein